VSIFLHLWSLGGARQPTAALVLPKGSNQMPLQLGLWRSNILREGRFTTSAVAMASALRLIAAAIFAPTASLAARSGSADRCA